MEDPPGTTRMPSSSVSARVGYVCLSKKVNGRLTRASPSTDWSIMRPTRKPARMPRFTHGTATHSAGSRTAPRCVARARCNQWRASSEYDPGAGERVAQDALVTRVERHEWRAQDLADAAQHGERRLDR